MSRYGDDPTPVMRAKGPNWGRVFAVVLSIVLAVVLIGGIAIYFLGHNLINLTNYVSDRDVQVVDKEALPEEAIETVATEEAVGEKISDEKLNEIHEEMSKAASQSTVTKTEAKNEEIFNFILVGVDRRDKSWNGNSDSMMLVSINFTDARVSIVSLMRDLYVNIPDVGYQKLNNAYARGGGPLLMQTISQNFDVELEAYAAVDFENMIEIIDALGGIDMEWTEAEITVANGYMMDMCNTLGMNGDDYILPVAAGTYHCNGVQAVAYARNRFVGNSDYARTERQRYVITQILARVKTMNIAEITAFATRVLPLVTHNFSEKDIWALVRRATDIMTYDFVKDRIPYDDLYSVEYVNSQDMLVPDWKATIEMLHETIYGSGKISDNYDNEADDRTSGNDDYSSDFADLILNGGAQEETPYYQEG